MLAAERGQEPLGGGGVGTILKRQRDQPQPGDPALGTRLKLRKRLSRERQRQRLTQKSARFLGGEAQIVAGQFDQLILNAQARQRQRRFRAGHHDDVNVWRQMIEQKADRLMHVAGRDGVEIFEDKDVGRFRQARQVVHQ